MAEMSAPIEEHAIFRFGRDVESLNRDCRCLSLDATALQRELKADLGARAADWPLLDTHDHLFAALPVFVSQAHVDRMATIIRAVEWVVALPAYREAVLDWAPPIAAFDPGPRGAFLGYDFHLAPEGPWLIEINTNAGGALWADRRRLFFKPATGYGSRAAYRGDKSALSGTDHEFPDAGRRVRAGLHKSLVDGSAIFAR